MASPALRLHPTDEDLSVGAPDLGLTSVARYAGWIRVGPPLRMTEAGLASYNLSGLKFRSFGRPLCKSVPIATARTAPFAAPPWLLPPCLLCSPVLPRGTRRRRKLRFPLPVTC